MSPEPRRLRCFDHPLGEAEGVLRLAWEDSSPGGGEARLELALGTGEGPHWREEPRRGGLSLPASAVPGLLQALVHLSTQGEHPMEPFTGELALKARQRVQFAFAALASATHYGPTTTTHLPPEAFVALATDLARGLRAESARLGTERTPEGEDPAFAQDELRRGQALLLGFSALAHAMANGGDRPWRLPEGYEPSEAQDFLLELAYLGFESFSNPR